MNIYQICIYIYRGTQVIFIYLQHRVAHLFKDVVFDSLSAARLVTRSALMRIVK